MFSSRANISILYRYLTDTLIAIPVKLDDVDEIIKHLSNFSAKNNFSEYIASNMLEFFTDVKNEKSNGTYDDGKITDIEISFCELELEEALAIFGDIHRNYDIKYIIDDLDKEVSITSSKAKAFNAVCQPQNKLTILEQEISKIDDDILQILIRNKKDIDITIHPQKGNN